MGDCKQRFRELTHPKDVVLDEDLAALQRTDERSRIRRYNELKESEEEFVWEFRSECPDFLTDAETDRVRGEFRLARLLVAASFYDEGEVPRAMADDFVEAELQAVVDFDRFKAFDALDEEGIERRIRRMEGEAYELVTDYHSTQLADWDDLLDRPEVQRDVMERLAERYEERFEKVRHGFYAYVESQGLEGAIEAVEEAVLAVHEAGREREAVDRELRSELSAAAEAATGLDDRQGRLEAELTDLERRLAAADDPEAVAGELASLRARGEDLTAAQSAAVEELADRLAAAADLEDRIDEKIADLESVEREARERARESAREETAALVKDELEALRDQREAVRRELDRIERERERIEAARERVDERAAELERAVESVDESLPDGRAGGDVVTSTMARLYEMDYVGRFDTSMHEADAVETPEGTFEPPEGYFEDRSEHASTLVPAETAREGSQGAVPGPTNQRARYEITESRYLGLGSEKRMVIEAVVASHLPAYEENGFDAAPADLDDLLEFVDEAVYEAERDDYHHLLGIASPTGWADRVLAELRDEDAPRTRFSRRVSVVLVDLGTGETHYDPADELAAGNAGLFELTVDAERVRAARELIREEYAADLGTDSVLLEDLVEEEGFGARVLKQAFEDLEAEGVGEQLYLDELGMSLAFER